MQPQTTAQGEPPEEKAPFGYRPVQRTLPNGSTTIEYVPYTVADVLHPEPDDVFPVRPIHAIDTRYLVNVFRVRAAAELSSQPIVYVSDDHLVDWGVPNQRNTAPDVAVFAGLKEAVGPNDGTFDLKGSGGRCVLVVEIVSPDGRRENDVVHKVREYYKAGVPLYVIVDQQKEGGPRQVRGYRHRSTGWEELANDEKGLFLAPLELWLGLKGERVVCYDVRTGRELGDYCRIAQELEEADRRNQEQEQVLEQAILDSREHRQARESAEKRAREQQQAREVADRAREAAEKQAREQKQAREVADRACAAAEELAREQQQARESAEKLVREQQQAREEAERQQRLQAEARAVADRARAAAENLAREQQQAAEERIRRLEEALRALQPPS